MLTPEKAQLTLARLFRRRRVADLDALFEALQTQSRMSVFRRLSAMGYYSSYSHAGRYYTLQDIPDFDAEGLWQYEGIGFSRHGSLKSTVEHLVTMAEAGRTHQELQLRLQVRVHNPLLELVREKRIGREPIPGHYLYVSPEPERSRDQLRLRRQQMEAMALVPAEMPLPIVIEVLLTVIQSGRTPLDAQGVTERLTTRGLSVTAEQVEAIFQRYDLKKTAQSRSRRWRR